MGPGRPLSAQRTPLEVCIIYFVQFKNIWNGQIFNQNNGFPLPSQCVVYGGRGNIITPCNGALPGWVGGNINSRNFGDMQDVPILNTATAITER